MNITHLSLSWSTSRGRDTYGYNICRLDDRKTGKRYKCNGGGYDMIGTVFGQWLQDVYQKELRALKDRAFYTYNHQEQAKGIKRHENADSLYGITANYLGQECYSVTLDGACGIESMIRIAEAIGLEVQREYQKSGRNRGETLGWYVSKAGE